VRAGSGRFLGVRRSLDFCKLISFFNTQVQVDKMTDELDWSLGIGLESNGPILEIDDNSNPALNLSNKVETTMGDSDRRPVTSGLSTEVSI